jgi:acyl carrier protein
MTKVTPDDVKAVIAEYLTEQSQGSVVYGVGDLPDDRDLLTDGLIDSLGLLSLIEALQERFGDSLDFEALDVDDLTIAGPLSQFVASELA